MIGADWQRFFVILVRLVRIFVGIVAILLKIGLFS